MRRALVVLVCSASLWGCASAGSPVSPAAGPGHASPVETLEQFTAALAANRWSDAYAMLSGRWRSRYTPARLATDYSTAGSVARDAADRVRALLGARQPFVLEGRTARLVVGEGKAAILLEEDGVWRVDALE